MKICQMCGKEFAARSKNAKYCPDCRGEAQRRRCAEYSRKHKERRREQQRARRAMLAKERQERQFTDITLTLIASALLRGESIAQIRRDTRWHKTDFEREYEKNKEAVKKRMADIQRHQQKVCALGRGY